MFEIKGKVATAVCYAKVVEDELGVPEWTIENGVLTGVALNGMEAVVVPSSVRTIGAGAFQHLDALVRIRVPGNVKTIEAQAFAWCSSLVDVSLEEGVEGFISAAKMSSAAFTSSNPIRLRRPVPSALTSL